MTYKYWKHVNIDTGPNPPKGKNILVLLAMSLKNWKNAQIIHPLLDRSERRYGFLCESVDHQRFIMVGRSTKPHVGAVVSTQVKALEKGIDLGIPIIMFWEGVLKVFDPKLIDKENIGVNPKADTGIPVPFINFHVSLGLKWEGKPLKETWMKTREATKNLLKTRRTLEEFF